MAEYAAKYRDMIFGSDVSAPAQDKTAAQKPYISGGGLLFVGDTFTTPSGIANNDYVYFGGMKIEPHHRIHAVQYGFDGNVEGSGNHNVVWSLVNVDNPASTITINSQATATIGSTVRGGRIELGLGEQADLVQRAEASYYLRLQFTGIGVAGITSGSAVSIGLWYTQE